VDAFRAAGGEPAIGDLVGHRYRLLGVLASRETTVVYEAVDESEGARVVVKRLRHEASPSLRRRFRREYECALAARGDDVVAVRTFIDDGVDEAIVFETLDGESLAARLEREGPLPEGVVVAIGAALFRALGKLHERGLVHRDIKPENVWLAARGLTLVDFGVAFFERSRADDGLTPTGTAMGTPRYASPQSRLGEGPPCAAFDLFAAAVTIYEALAGANPFEANDDAGLVGRLLDEPPTPIRAFRKDIAPGWETFFGRALARRESERFLRAADAERALLDVVRAASTRG
jgi:serine/threonine protein kinase